MDWNALGTVLTAFAALAALLFTGLSLQQARAQNGIAEQGQITDRYNNAVTNLGSSSLDQRIGGIYALQRIMQDSARDQDTIVGILSAFVRVHAPCLPARLRRRQRGPRRARLLARSGPQLISPQRWTC